EAMASGLPIAASAVGGIPDMVTDDVSALLRPCETAPMLEAINRLLDDEVLRRRLGQKALAESGRFSQQTMAQGYCRVYAGHCE
ncbi:glycosyltransferase, partial [Acinetobacter pittii]|uniref:glycosyltransferase n=1 Tax=Acinetobacter pittii TaxID=48296 RepID=UPI002813AEDD